jgi:threonine/homoserine/homoserine lactone efflux protein
MQIGPETLFMAILFLVPLVMAFLSLTLKDSTNRWANIVLGVSYTGLQLYELAYTFALAQPSAYRILMDISKVVAPALIIWYAWKSKQ